MTNVIQFHYSVTRCGAASDIAFHPLDEFLFAVGCDEPWVRLFDLRMQARGLMAVDW